MDYLPPSQNSKFIMASFLKQRLTVVKNSIISHEINTLVLQKNRTVLREI
jgi:hypothetical protein